MAQTDLLVDSGDPLNALIRSTDDPDAFNFDNFDFVNELFDGVRTIEVSMGSSTMIAR